jgi:hypothetical protein
VSSNTMFGFSVVIQLLLAMQLTLWPTLAIAY